MTLWFMSEQIDVEIEAAETGSARLETKVDDVNGQERGYIGWR
jgi:hypothetical protein